MIALKITPELTCDKICKEVQKILGGDNHQGDTFLVIDVKRVEQVIDDFLPRLTYEA